MLSAQKKSVIFTFFGKGRCIPQAYGIVPLIDSSVSACCSDLIGIFDQLCPHLSTTMSVDGKNVKRLRSNTDSNESAGLTLEIAMQMLTERFDETNKKIDSLKADLDTKLDEMKLELQTQIDEVKSDINELQDTCNTDINSIRSEIGAIDNRVESVSETVCRLENRTELIAVGIPYLANENLRDHLLCIAQAIGFDTDKLSHVQCKRLRSGSLTNGDQCFTLLQFSMPCLRDEFFAKYLSKRDLGLKHIGIKSERRIFINENLTMNAREIKRAALKLRRENKVTVVSTKLGIVYVKKTTDGPAVAITSIDQLKHL